MKKIFIIEDNDKDFEKICEILNTNFQDVEIYPSNLIENRELRKCIKALFSARDNTSIPARNFLMGLNINEYNGVILDYELFPSNKLVNGIELYKELKINIKALILTKYTGRKYDVIDESIQKEGFSSNILVKQKGNLVILTDEQKDEHIKNINQHLFSDSSTETLSKKKIIEKLNANKPKLNSATDSINKEIFELTDVLILKINETAFNIKNDLNFNLEFKSDAKYLQVLIELNSQICQ